MNFSPPFQDPIQLKDFPAGIRCVCSTDKYVYASYDEKIRRVQCAGIATDSAAEMHVSNVKGIASLLTSQLEWVVLVADTKGALLVLKEDGFGDEKALVDTGIQKVECFTTDCSDGELVVVLKETHGQRRLQTIRVECGAKNTCITLQDVKIDAVSVRNIVSISSGTILLCKDGKVRYLPRDGSECVVMEMPEPLHLSVIGKNEAHGLGPTRDHAYAVFKNRIINTFTSETLELPEFKEYGDLLAFAVRYPFAYLLQNDRLVVYDLPFSENSWKIVPLGKSVKECRSMCVLHDWSVVLARQKESLLFVPFNSSDVDWIRNMFEKRNELKAIETASALKNRDLVSRLGLTYGVNRLMKGHFKNAFQEFNRFLEPNERVEKVISLFTKFLPKEEPSGLDDPIVRIRERAKNFAVPDTIQITEGAITELKNFLENAKSEDFDHVIKSMLFECYAILGDKTTEELEQFIEENEKSILESTLQFLEQYGTIDQLVMLIQRKSEQTAQTFFRTVYEAKGPDAAAMFSSSRLNRIEQVENILRFLGSREYMKSPQDRLESQIIFLRSCPETPQLAGVFLGEKLMALYIDFFKSYSVSARERAGKYVSIADEKEPMRRWRLSFLEFLEKVNSKVFLDVPSQKLEDLMLLEELLVILRRQNRTDACISLISRHQMPISTAIEACESMLPQNRHIFTHLFQSLASEKSEQCRNYLLTLLNTKADRLVLSDVIPHIPDDVPLADIRKFLQYITVNLENEVRQAKLEHALAESVLKTRRSQIAILKKGSVLVTADTLCQGCNKPITKDQAFCVTRMNLVFHAGCVPKTEVDIDSLDISYDGNC